MAEGRQCETSGLFRIDRVARSRALGLIRLASAIQNCSIRKVFTSPTPRDKHYCGRFFLTLLSLSLSTRSTLPRKCGQRCAGDGVASPKKFGSLDQYRASCASNVKDTSAKIVILNSCFYLSVFKIHESPFLVFSLQIFSLLKVLL